MGEVIMKTAEEIEEEKNKPKPPSESERIKDLEEVINMMLMEGY